MKTIAFAAACLVAAAPLARADALSGFWRGEAGSVEMELELVEGSNGAVSGWFRSLAQGTEVPLSGRRDGDAVRLEIPATGFTLTAELDGSDLDGEAVRGGSALDLSLEREEPRAPSVRAQDPKPPLGYLSQDVSFAGPAGALAGTLTVPDGEAPFPAVVLVTPEGPQDRNAQAFAHRPNLVLADALTRAGFAVLRYDDRGVGASAGDYLKATTIDFTADASAALAFLKTRPEIDAARIGILGRSNGASIAAIAGRSGAAAAVLISPSSMLGAEAANAATARDMRSNGDDEDDIAERIALQTKAFAVAANPAMSDKDIRATVEALIDEAAGALSIMVSDEMIEAMSRQLSLPWFRHYLAYDPKPDFARLTIPVLVLYGEKDTTNAPTDNADAVLAVLKSGGAQAELKILPGLAAALATAIPDRKASAFDREETLAPAALDAIIGWLKTALRAGG